nr:hypothetical protein [Tanacetum cinerariifolium]
MSAARNQTELLLNQLDLGVTGTIMVVICRMWDINVATGRYLSTDFIVSDTKIFGLPVILTPLWITDIILQPSFVRWRFDKVRTKKGWNYPSCEEEKFKITPNELLAMRLQLPTCRYMLKLEISDDTAEVVVVMFDETKTSLLKCSTSSILDFEDQVYFLTPYNLANMFTDLRLQDEEDHLGVNYGMVVENDASKAPALKRLNKFPSVATPSKPDEEKKQRREELEDSDIEGSFVAGSQLKGGDNSQI